jgi:transcriptional regulator
MVLKTLEAMGPMHGYGIARRIEQIGEDAVQVNQGTIYLCLVRLVQQGWITAAWGTSDHNRRAKFYRLSALGRRELEVETGYWRRVATAVTRVLETS